MDFSGILAQQTGLQGRSFLAVLDQQRPAGWDEIFGSHTFHEVTMYYPMRLVRTRQLERLRVRGQLLMRAQSAVYASIGGFVATALLAVVGAAADSASHLASWILGGGGMVLGSGAAGSLLYGCVLIVRETRLALAGLRDDVSPFEEPLDEPEPL